MHEECLICKAPLVYATEATLMECMICHKQEMSKTSCVEGHYVCNDCHSGGLDQIVGLCLNETSSNPIEILEKMMSMSFCHMHGPEHHVMVGASLLTAYHNAGGQIELAKALQEIDNDLDAFLIFSAFLSMATDNAKDPKLAKINAGPEMLGLYTAGFTIGLSVDQLIEIALSPTGIVLS